MARRRRPAWAARIGVAALALAAAPAAHAHAVLVAIVPADGAEVKSSPRQVLLRFHGPVAPAPAVQVLAASGRSVELGAIARPAADAIVVPLAEPLRPGRYTVLWHLHSPESHPVDGSSSFSVGAPAGGPVGLTLLVCVGAAALAVPLGVAARSTRRRIPIALGAVIVLAVPFAPHFFSGTQIVQPGGYFTTATSLGPFGLELGVSPDAPGTNTIDLVVTDRTGRRVDLPNISVTAAHALSPPRSFRAERLAPGHFTVDVARLTSPGIWQLRIRARGFERTISLPLRA